MVSNSICEQEGHIQERANDKAVKTCWSLFEEGCEYEPQALVLDLVSNQEDFQGGSERHVFK